MRAPIIAAALLAACLPGVAAEPDPLSGMCDEGNTVGDALRHATGECGGTVEPWQCLGGAQGSKTYHVGPYDVVVNQCESGLPDIW